MHPPRILIVAVAAALALSLVSSAFAQLHWAIAKRSDEEIRSRIPKLMNRLEQTPGAMQAAVVILEKGHNFRLEKQPPEEFAADQQFRFLAPKLCLNQVFLVRDPASLPDVVTRPYFSARGTVVDVAAFHLRGDKLTRLKSSAWQVEEGDGHVTRGRVTFQFGELKKGDVLGYSLVTESSEPLFVASIAAADRVPVVYYSLRVLANGAVTYDIKGVGFAKPPAVKSAETKNARPSAWQVSAASLAAIADLPEQGPYTDDVPHFDVSAASVYFQSESMGFAEWARVSGWNLAVSNLASDERMGSEGLDVRVSVLTTSATSPEDKFRAIAEYVRDQIQLLEGDRHDRGGARKTAKEVLEAGQATATEKVLVTLAMAKVAGVEAQLVLARPNAYGAVDERGSLLQFTDQIVRHPGETPIVFVPECTDCPLGTLPPAWDGAMLLVPRAKLDRVVSEFMEKHMQQAMSEGRFSPQGLMAAIENEKWYSLENMAAPTPAP